MYQPIIIPKEYWLDVNNFDFNKFTYDDIRCIYNSPRSLIDDFEKINGFKQHTLKLIEQNKLKINKKLNKLQSPIGKKINKKLNNNFGTKLVDMTKKILINLSLLKTTK